MLTLRKYIYNQKGSFLIELMVGLVVMVIIMGTIFSFMSSTYKSYLFNMAQGRNIEGARDILNAVNDEIRYATLISTPTSGQTTSEIDYIVNNDSVLRKISIVNGSLVIAYNGTTHRTLAINNMQLINFKYETISGKAFMTISVQLKSSSYSNSPSLSPTTTVYMQELNIWI